MSLSIHSICVFCGSADHLATVYYESAHATGKLLADRHIQLVYGAGRTGLMGAVADSCLAAGGEVYGIAPKGMESPQLIYTSELTKSEIVENIQLRKARMAELADAFIALPGGYGTLDELSEVLTWSQIGTNRKPLGILNTNGYFDHLLKWIDRAYADHFIYDEHMELFVVDTSPEGLLDKLLAYNFPDRIERWLVREE